MVAIEGGGKVAVENFFKKEGDGRRSGGRRKKKKTRAGEEERRLGSGRRKNKKKTGGTGSKKKTTTRRGKKEEEDGGGGNKEEEEEEEEEEEGNKKEGIGCKNIIFKAKNKGKLQKQASETFTNLVLRCMIFKNIWYLHTKIFITRTCVQMGHFTGVSYEIIPKNVVFQKMLHPS